MLRGVGGGREDERATARLAGDDCPGFGTEVHRTRSRFSLSKKQPVAVHLGPTQTNELSFAAASEEQKLDDIGLLPSGPSGAVGIKRRSQALDFDNGQEASGFWSRVASNCARRIGGKVSPRNGMVEDLCQHVKSAICAGGGSARVTVEPTMYVLGRNPVERHSPEFRHQLSSEQALNPCLRGRRAAIEAGVHPGIGDELGEGCRPHGAAIASPTAWAARDANASSKWRYRRVVAGSR